MNRPTNQIRRRPDSAARIPVKEPKRFRFPFFWVTLLLFVLVSAFLISGVLRKVTHFLEEYESIQPKYAETEIFEKYFSPIDYDALLEYSGRGGESDLTEFETREDLIEYLKALYGDKEITYYSISTGTSGSSASPLDIKNIAQFFVDQFNSKGDIKYIVKADNDKIAEFTLSHSEDPSMKSMSGFKKYELSNITLFFFPHESVTVKLPKSSTLKINGTEVNESHRIEDVYEETDSVKHMPEGTEGIVYVAYLVKDLYLKPEITVTDKDGKNTAVEYIEEDNYYSSDFVYDDALAAQQSAYVINAIEKYAAYMQMDGARRDFIDFFDTESDLWKNIISTENYFVWDHTGFSFRNQSASEFYSYSPDVFSCRVKMEHLLHNYGREDYVDYIDMTLYLKKSSDGVFRIYDSFAHE